MFLEFIELHSQVGLWILGLMTSFWVLSLVLKDSSIVDIIWGAGFVMSVWVSFSNTLADITPRHWLIAVLVTIWGLRLSLHIFFRNKGKGEDFRYKKWRAENGDSWWWRSFFKVFLTQGLLMWLISSPLTAAQLTGQPEKLIWLDYLAVLIWALGFFFESVGDIQLTRFRKNPENKGKLLKTGVWRFTRHPNYFGDATQWWAYYLIALAAGAWWVIFSPILMTHFLVNVSGVAMLEKTLIAEKPDYREYAQETNAFIPWFPRINQNKS